MGVVREREHVFAIANYLSSLVCTGLDHDDVRLDSMNARAVAV